MPAPEETAVGRWTRDQGNAAKATGDNRLSREISQQSEGRKERIYVNYTDRDPQGDTATVGPTN
jgi:hypothetical protein